MMQNMNLHSLRIGKNKGINLKNYKRDNKRKLETNLLITPSIKANGIIGSIAEGMFLRRVFVIYTIE